MTHQLHIFVLMLVLVIVIPGTLAQSASDLESAPYCKQSGAYIGAPNPNGTSAGSVSPCKLPPGLGISKTSHTILAMVISLAFGVGAALLVRMVVVRLWRLGKITVGWVDPDGRLTSVQRYSAKVGQIETKEGTARLDGRERYSGAINYFMDPLRGTTFHFPTSAETVDANPILAIASVSNHATYHAALHRLKWRDVIRAGEEDDKTRLWIVLGVLGFCSLIAILGVVIYLAATIHPGH